MEHIIELLIPIFWLIGIGTISYLVFRKFSDVIVAKVRYSSTTKNYSGDKNIDQQLDSFIQNAPRLLTEIHAEITKQRESGVTDDQMKGLISKQKMFEFLVQNREIIDILGKPILKKLVGFIKAI